MDSQLVSGSLFDSVGDERASSSPFLTYTEQFYEVFPYYLSIGMSAEQFWDGDCTLAKYYRKAEEIRRERHNQECWLQGLYVYEAICDVSPVLHAFAKKGAKPHPYTTTPYALTEKQRDKEAEAKEIKSYEKGRDFMKAAMLSLNKRFNGDSSEK